MHERVGGVEHGLELALDGSIGAAAPVAGVHVKAECRLSWIRVDPPATGEPRTGLTVLRARREPTRRGAPRGAACGPLPAGRCIRHSHTSSGYARFSMSFAGLAVTPRPAVAGWRPPGAARAAVRPLHRPVRNAPRRTPRARSARR